MKNRSVIVIVSLMIIYFSIYIFPYFQPIEEFNLDEQELALIRNLSKISELSYSSLETISNHPTEEGCTLMRAGTHPRIQMNWLVNECSEKIIIGIQGTANIANIKMDVDFKPVYDSSLGIKIHRGFNTAAKEIHAEISALVPGIFDKKKKYIFTGHSLGGAAALIMGMRVKKRGHRVKVVTFGQPKVTYKKGAEKYVNFPLLRVVMLDDPITNNTKSIWYFLFSRPSHFGSILILTGNQKYLALKEELHDTRGWDQKTFIINNHYIKNYIKELEQMIIESERSYLDERLLVFDILYSPNSYPY